MKQHWLCAAVALAIGTSLLGGAGGRVALAATADPCPNAMTQLAINDCMARDAATAHAAETKAYAAALAAASRSQRASIIAGERAWRDRRDAKCRAAAAKYAGGSIVPSVIDACQATADRARTVALRRRPSPAPR